MTHPSGLGEYTDEELQQELESRGSLQKCGESTEISCKKCHNTPVERSLSETRRTGDNTQVLDEILDTYIAEFKDTLNGRDEDAHRKAKQAIDQYTAQKVLEGKRDELSMVVRCETDDGDVDIMFYKPVGKYMTKEERITELSVALNKESK